MLALGVVAIAIGLSWQQAIRSARRAEAATLLAQAELRFLDDPTEALALATHSLERTDTPEARSFVMKALWDAPPAFEFAGSGYVAAPAFSPDGKWLAVAGHSSEARVWSERGGSPLVLPGHDVSPRGTSVAQWASDRLLVTGLPGHLASRVFVWSLPKGERVRTIDFGQESWWQAISGRLLAYTSNATPDGHGHELLRSWRLPDGEAEGLGHVDLAGLGASEAVFEPDGRHLLYVKGRDVFARALPAGSSPDRSFDRVPAGLARIDAEPDRLVVVDRRASTGSGATTVAPFASGRWSPARALRALACIPADPDV
jgi:hypothetical protein